MNYLERVFRIEITTPVEITNTSTALPTSTTRPTTGATIVTSPEYTTQAVPEKNCNCDPSGEQDDDSFCMSNLMESCCVEHYVCAIADSCDCESLETDVAPTSVRVTTVFETTDEEFTTMDVTTMDMTTMHTVKKTSVNGLMFDKNNYF